MTEKEIEQRFEENKYLIPYVYDKILKNNRIRLEKEDVLSEGRVGLLQAIKNYDKDKGYSFSTLAYKLIKNRMLMYVRSLSSKIVKNTVSNDGETFLVSDYKIRNTFDSMEENLIDHEIMSNLKRKLKIIFDGLFDRDKIIFQNRLLGISFSDIANRLGVSKQRISSRYNQIILIVKKAIVCMNDDKEFPKETNYADTKTYKTELRKYLKRLIQKNVDIKNNLIFENI